MSKLSNMEISRESVELDALLETTVDAIITIRPDGIIQRFNRAAEVMFGFGRDEVIGQNVKCLMPDQYATEHDRYLHDYATTGVKHIIGTGRAVLGRRKNGEIFHLDLSVGEMLPPYEGFVGILRDITDRVEAERKLLEHSRELARSNEDLTQFAYIASHDLKAPLQGIDNLASWIEEKVGAHMDEECTTYMRLLRNRISRLDSLLSSLLQYSRIGRRNTVLEPLNLNAVLQETLDLLDLGNFALTVDPLPTFEASQTEISMLFQNLITNAMKHHDRDHGRIHVSYQDQGLFHEFHVEDDGPGIPEDMRDRVFGMFQTLHPRDRVEGSGMGLAFVKKIIERNGAEVFIQPSTFERGTAVVILWPKDQRSL